MGELKVKKYEGREEIKLLDNAVMIEIVIEMFGSLSEFCSKTSNNISSASSHHYDLKKRIKNNKPIFTGLEKSFVLFLYQEYINKDKKLQYEPLSPELINSIKTKYNTTPAPKK